MHIYIRLFPCQPFRLLRLNRPTRWDGRRIKHDLKVEEFTLFNVYQKSALVPRGFHEIIIRLIERRRMQIERVFPDNGIYYYEPPHASPFVIKPYHHIIRHYNISGFASNKLLCTIHMSRYYKSIVYDIT